MVWCVNYNLVLFFLLATVSCVSKNLFRALHAHKFVFRKWALLRCNIRFQQLFFFLVSRLRNKIQTLQYCKLARLGQCWAFRVMVCYDRRSLKFFPNDFPSQFGVIHNLELCCQSSRVFAGLDRCGTNYSIFKSAQCRVGMRNTLYRWHWSIRDLYWVNIRMSFIASFSVILPAGHLLLAHCMKIIRQWRVSLQQFVTRFEFLLGSFFCWLVFECQWLLVTSSCSIL